MSWLTGSLPSKTRLRYSCTSVSLLLRARRPLAIWLTSDDKLLTVLSFTSLSKCSTPVKVCSVADRMDCRLQHCSHSDRHFGRACSCTRDYAAGCRTCSIALTMSLNLTARPAAALTTPQTLHAAYSLMTYVKEVLYETCLARMRPVIAMKY